MATFIDRHVGPSQRDIDHICYKVVGVSIFG